MTDHMIPKGLRELMRIFGTDRGRPSFVEHVINDDGDYVIHIAVPRLKHLNPFSEVAVNALFHAEMQDKLNLAILDRTDYGEVSSMAKSDLPTDSYELTYHVVAKEIEKPATVQRLKTLYPEFVQKLIDDCKKVADSSVTYSGQYPRANQMNQQGWMPPSAPNKSLSALNDIDIRIKWEEVADKDNPSLKTYRTAKPFPNPTKFVEALGGALELDDKKAITVDANSHICIVGGANG